LNGGTENLGIEIARHFQNKNKKIILSKLIFGHCLYKKGSTYNIRWPNYLDVSPTDLFSSAGSFPVHGWCQTCIDTEKIA